MLDVYVQLNDLNIVIGYSYTKSKSITTKMTITEDEIEFLVGNYKLDGEQLIELTEEEKQIDICTTKTNQELQEEIENLKAQLEAVHERLCTQQEMSATVIASVFGNEVLKNE